MIHTTHRSAAAARSAAIDTALRHWGDAVDGVWVATPTTDADTVVGSAWLSTHLAWAEAGFDGVAGLVGVASKDDDEDLATRYLASIAPQGTAQGHAHVHGANLGFRASRWRAVGGCGAGGDGEDHRLWERFRAHGAQLPRGHRPRGDDERPAPRPRRRRVRRLPRAPHDGRGA